MLNLIISSVLTIYLYSGYGLLINKKREIDLTFYSEIIIFGSIILSLISLLVNFVLPLSKIINTCLFIILIFPLFKFRNYFFNKKYIIFLLITTSIVILLLFGSHAYRPDAGLYHLPYIKILNTEKIIFGLTNFHFRFGHVSIIQYLSAINYNIFSGFNGIVIPSALIAVSVILNFLAKIRNHILDKNFNFHFYFLLGVLVYIFIKMNRYSEYGNDAPAHFLTFFLFSEFLKLKIEKIKIDNILNISLISVFVFLNKITLLVLLVIPIILIYRKFSFNYFKRLKFYLILLLLFSWTLKNLIVSGCILYPVNITCFKSFNWTDIKTVEKISLENEAFSKNWPNFDNKNEVDQQNYVKNFKWFKSWLKKFRSEQKEKSFAYTFILLILSLIIVSKTKRGTKLIDKHLLLLNVLIFSFLLWFIKIPDYRYGYSIIISLITFPFALLLSSRKFESNPKKLFYSIIILFVSVFFLKNLIRITNTKDYFDYPNVRIYSHNDQNKPLNYIKRSINNEELFIQKDGYCMYYKSPCTPYDINIDVNRKNGYLVFLNKT